MADGDRERFEARWETLNLDLDELEGIGAGTSLRRGTQASLSSAETVVASQPSPSSSGEMSLLPIETLDVASAPPPPALTTLPRITLGQSSGASTSPATGRHADLRLLGVLGEGGMGRVHVAEQRSLGRRVAVKMLKEDAGDAARATLLSEAVITGFLEHPGIIPVHVLGVDDEGRPILVMKRVEGISWADLLENPDAEAWSWKTLHDDRLMAHLEIFMQVCNAVSFAHEHGVVHRDIKPDNVMIGRFGEVYLLDWGVALRLTDDPERHAGELVGTPGYIAPEMVMGGAVTPAADVYLLGATLHEVLTGTLRHDGESLHDLLLAAYESKPVAYGPDVPEELAALAQDATRREPEDRPASAADLRARVKDYLRHRGSVALSDAAAERLRALGAIDVRTDARTLAEARRLASQARFGFEQALDQWAQNRGAKRGLEATIAEVVKMEIAREDAEAARAALGELERPPAELVRQVEALEERLAADRAEAARLQVMAAEMDPRVSRRQRLLLSAVMLGFGVGVTMVAIRRSETAGLEYSDTIRFAGAITAAILLGAFVYRRSLLRNQFNRALSGTLIFAAIGVMAHRLLLWPFEPDIPIVFAGDLVVLALAAGIGSLTLLRWLRYTALVCLAGAVGVSLLPEHAPKFFAMATVGGLATLVIFWRRTA